MRIYDPRLGRFLSVDPITKKYPELTPYQFASNTPIRAIDIDGLEAWFEPLLLFSRSETLIKPITETVVKTGIEKGTESSMTFGRAIHRLVQETWRNNEGFRTERGLGTGNRVDGLKFDELMQKGTIRELKPNNVLGRSRGIEQLGRYLDAAMKKYPDVQEWTPELHLYEPTFAGLYYKVEKGDNLTKIANKFGVSMDNILELNNIDDKNVIKTGESLLIDISVAYKNKNAVIGNEVKGRDNTNTNIDEKVSKSEIQRSQKEECKDCM